MSSLEEPLGMDKLPGLSTIDLFQRFSSNGCSTSRGDTGMGSCWIEQNTSSSSNSYEEDFEYEQEAFTWRHHARDMPENDIISRSQGRNYAAYGNRCDSRHLANLQDNSYRNDACLQDITNKVTKQPARIFVYQKLSNYRLLHLAQCRSNLRRIKYSNYIVYARF